VRCFLQKQHGEKQLTVACCLFVALSDIQRRNLTRLMMREDFSHCYGIAMTCLF